MRNCLLSALLAEDYAILRPDLESVMLAKDDVLIEPNMPFEHIYFPERGVGSIVASTADSRRVETGIFGRDGMSGVWALLGPAETTQLTIVQVAGDGHRLPVAALRAAVAQSPSLHATFLRYVQVHLTQTSYTALSNATQTVEERLARWLLMTHDRVDGDELSLTHEFLSIMLAVRRPSVTGALHILEGNRLVRAKRGLITVLDRDGLVEFADGSYGTPEDEYRRLVGKFG